MNRTRKLIPATALIGALLLGAVSVTAAAAGKDPLKGVWYSTDTDGSAQRLTIGGGPAGSYRVRYFDDGATVCGLDPDSGEFLYAASAAGWLTGAGGSLSGILPVYCLASPPYLYNNSAFAFTYDATTDTLTDSYGVVWTH